VEYEGIGVVKYIYNPKARNFTIRINPKGEIRVTIPRFGSLRQAEKFLLSRKTWIQKKQHDIRKNYSDTPLLKEGLEIVVRDKRFILKAGTNGHNVESAFWKILVTEAKQILPERVREISHFYNLPYRNLKIRKMKTRWGSCSSQNAISLNAWLVLLPDHLVDYVILHELVHTVHKNHSPAFWDLMERLSHGRAKPDRRELRNHRILYRVED